jgi:hypothetical protein
MRLLGWLSFSILGVCPSILHAQDNETLKERADELVPRLADADEGIRLSARMELERLGEVVLAYLPQEHSNPAIRAAVRELRGIILAGPALEKIEARLRQAQLELHLLASRLASRNSLELSLRAQRVRHRLLFDQVEALTLRRGIIDLRERTLGKLQVRFERFILNRTEESLAETPSLTWARLAEALSDVTGIDFEIDERLEPVEVAVPQDGIDATLDELLSSLARASQTAYTVTDRGIRISR